MIKIISKHFQEQELLGPSATSTPQQGYTFVRETLTRIIYSSVLILVRIPPLARTIANAIVIILLSKFQALIEERLAAGRAPEEIAQEINGTPVASEIVDTETRKHVTRGSSGPFPGLGT